MKHTTLFFTVLLTAPGLSAELQLLSSFHTETKIRGGFVEHAGRYYFTAEKGGDLNFGFIGHVNPADGQITVVHSFTTDAKPKGGLVRVGNHLYLQGEKGASTTGFGWVGRFDPSRGEFTELAAYSADVKPKSGLTFAGGSLWLATERGGAGAGSIDRFDLNSQTLLNAATLTFETGLKIESLAATEDGSVLFAGAREGGDAAEVGGKGAGTLLRLNTGTGELTRLVAFKAAEHGTKLRGLTLHGGRLWFVMEEGGDLSLNSGKGGGSILSYNLADGSLRQHHRFDGAGTGLKPRGFARVGNDFYFATEGGSAGGLGVFGVLRSGTSAAPLAEFSPALSAKPDHHLSVIGQRIVFATELGGPGYLGGILTYALPAPVTPPRLQAERLADGGLRLSWNDPDRLFGLQTAPALGGAAWTDFSPAPERAGDTVRVEIQPDAPAQFFRLRSQR